MRILPDRNRVVDPQFSRTPNLVAEKHVLAQQPPTSEQLVTLRAAGHTGEVPSRLWAAELIGHLLRQAVRR